VAARRRGGAIPVGPQTRLMPQWAQLPSRRRATS
jgi:hypothetical protein